MSLEQRVDILERQVRSLRHQAKGFDSWLDTLATPPWKKVWFLLCGWRWYRVGRWYPAWSEILRRLRGH